MAKFIDLNGLKNNLRLFNESIVKPEIKKAVEDISGGDSFENKETLEKIGTNANGKLTLDGNLVFDETKLLSEDNVKNLIKENSANANYNEFEEHGGGLGESFEISTSYDTIYLDNGAVKIDTSKDFSYDYHEDGSKYVTYTASTRTLSFPYPITSYYFTVSNTSTLANEVKSIKSSYTWLQSNLQDNLQEVRDEINNINTFKTIVVDTLPTENIDEKAIYLLRKSDPTTGDTADEYVYSNGSFERIGSIATIVEAETETIDFSTWSGYVAPSPTVTGGTVDENGNLNIGSDSNVEIDPDDIEED